MAVTLNDAISWENAGDDDGLMLDNLQPNILKGHVREFLTVLFLRFDDAAQARSFLKALAGSATVKGLMKSAKVHLQEVKAFKTLGKEGTSYVGVGLTGGGYDKLGIVPAKKPADPSFRQGMKTAQLGDPATNLWDAAYQQQIDAVVLVGDKFVAARNTALAKVKALLATRPKIIVLGEERGVGQHNKHGEGIEHFGYVDGRSQPFFLKEDVREEMLERDGATNWDPKFALSRVIVPDPAAPDPARHFGSYFVFRKLEQNVRKFKGEEDKLATRLALKGADEERAGAMIVGRFEDGTPLTLQAADGDHNPVPNDFDYDSDPEGGKCPFFGHIRKMNPRGSGGFEPVAQERLHIMARRGQTYGTRTDDLNDGRINNKPTKDVGLLFMAFNSNIGEQFEFVQKNWANNPGFPKVPPGAPQPGLDLVIGQGARPGISCPVTWGAPIAAHKSTTAVPQAVTMKGGEYFFMPSLPFLRAL